MHKALYWKKQGNNIKCELCPHNCIISENKVGICRVRKNIKGTLYSLVYGKASSVAIDPIEKKPLFHFLPGTAAFSVGTVGCNLQCKHCQNWEISQTTFEEEFMRDLPPEEIVKQAKENNCASIAYTYNDPIIFYEYALDTAKLAKKAGIKNILVTNGFINQAPLKEWSRYMDAVNIDLKAFTEEFYCKTTNSHLEPVLNTIKFIKNKTKMWLELTNLIIPTLNDKEEDIKAMCEWIVTNLGPDNPLHFSRFFPYFKLEHLPPTDEKTLLTAKEIAKEEGIKYIYIGNIQLPDAQNTYCAKCGELVIQRDYFTVTKINKHNHKIPGVWR